VPWFRGDFHCHTTHSDGELSPPQLAAVAVAHGLDFVFVTDHNTTSTFGRFGDDPGVLVGRGVEVTYERGHCNVFGITGAEDWLAQLRFPYPSEPTSADPYPSIDALIGRATAAGGLVSINHPFLAPRAWTFRPTDLAAIEAVEIWNDPSSGDNRAANPRAIAWWTELLVEGYRPTAIGGSDYHRPMPRHGEHKPCDELGLPATWVLASACTEAAILDGVRNGRVWVEHGATAALTVMHAGVAHPVGADLGHATGTATVSGSIADGAVPGVARLVRDGAVIDEAPLVGGAWTFATDLELAGEGGWVRLDAYDRDGLLLAITNPVYL
jgi:hypothetical protein